MSTLRPSLVSNRIRRYLAGEAPVEALERIEDNICFEEATRVGSGSVGDVLRVRDLATARPLALKVVSLERLGRLGLCEEGLRREVRSMSELRHPNIVQLVDVFAPVLGGVPCVESEPPHVCIVMEYVDMSWALSKTICTSGAQPQLGLAVLHQLASALKLVHAMGIVHRDVWAENVLINQDAHVVLIDFGCAEFVAGPPSCTSLNIPYCSPQAAQGGPQHPGDDAWALGLLATELATGLMVSQRLGRTDVPMHRAPPQLQQALMEALSVGGPLLSHAASRLLEVAVERRASMADLLALLSRGPVDRRPTERLPYANERAASALVRTASVPAIHRGGHSEGEVAGFGSGRLASRARTASPTRFFVLDGAPASHREDLPASPSLRAANFCRVIAPVAEARGVHSRSQSHFHSLLPGTEQQLHDGMRCPNYVLDAASSVCDHQQTASPAHARSVSTSGRTRTEAEASPGRQRLYNGMWGRNPPLVDGASSRAAPTGHFEFSPTLGILPSIEQHEATPVGVSAAGGRPQRQASFRVPRATVQREGSLGFPNVVDMVAQPNSGMVAGRQESSTMTCQRRLPSSALFPAQALRRKLWSMPADESCGGPSSIGGARPALTSAGRCEGQLASTSIVLPTQKHPQQARRAVAPRRMQSHLRPDPVMTEPQTRRFHEQVLSDSPRKSRPLRVCVARNGRRTFPAACRADLIEPFAFLPRKSAAPCLRTRSVPCQR